MSTRAVLTGDLVKSTGLDSVDLTAARSVVLRAAAYMEAWSPGLIEAEPDFFRGDSWQLLLREPRFCLRAAMFMRARLRGADYRWDTRVAIGLGGVARVNKKRTSLSTGEAFTLSGRALDTMGAASNMVVAAGPGAPADGLAPLSALCSVLIDDWSSRQAEVAALALVPSPLTQAEIAERIGISQQAVSKALASARVPALLQAVGYCERLDWNPRLPIT